MEREINLMHRYWVAKVGTNPLATKPEGEIIFTSEDRNEVIEYQTKEKVIRFDAAARRFIR